MKRWKHILIAFVPSLIGFALNYSFFLSVGLFSLFFTLSPFAVLFIWGFTGHQFAKWKTSMPYAILVANSVGILSLLLYIWQFVRLVVNEIQPTWLSSFSLMFSDPIAILSTGIVLPFRHVIESEPNFIGSATALWIQIAGLVIMLLVFTLGFILGKIRSKLQLRKSPLAQDLENADSDGI